MIAACLSEEKEIIAPYVFDGYTDATRFNGWGKECLLPCLKKGQIVVMDNASFHKKKLTKMLIESIGCSLLYQPTYSSDLNPIEKQWAVRKRKYRKFKFKGYEHKDTDRCRFLSAIIKGIYYSYAKSKYNNRFIGKS